MGDELASRSDTPVGGTRIDRIRYADSVSSTETQRSLARTHTPTQWSDSDTTSTDSGMSMPTWTQSVAPTTESLPSVPESTPRARVNRAGRTAVHPLPDPGSPTQVGRRLPLLA